MCLQKEQENKLIKQERLLPCIRAQFFILTKYIGTSNQGYVVLNIKPLRAASLVTDTNTNIVH